MGPGVSGVCQNGLWSFQTLAHEKLVHMIGRHCVGINNHECQPYLQIAIYVLKSANDETPLYYFCLLSYSGLNKLEGGGGKKSSDRM